VILPLTITIIISTHTMLKTQKKNTKIGCIQICKVLKKGRKLDESLMKAPAKDVDISKPFTD
jgi:hypothetical protein